MRSEKDETKEINEKEMNELVDILAKAMIEFRLGVPYDKWLYNYIPPVNKLTKEK